MFYRYPSKQGVEAINIQSLEFIAIFHTIAAILLVVFIVTHLYLITTGETVTSNLKAMLTGYEELEDDDKSDKKVNEQNLSTEKLN
jgi:cytochrome b subunit of formate dehydrogenase